jgi:hypothetical protein
MKSIFEEFPISYKNNNADDPPAGNLFLFQSNKNDPIQETDISNY